MSRPAPRGSAPEAQGGALAAAAVRGLAAFGAALGVGLAIAMAEYAASGLYRPWTWVKVGIAYVLAFCGVSLRAVVGGFGPLAPPGRIEFVYRLPLYLGLVPAAWLLYRAGRRAGSDPATSRARGWPFAAAASVCGFGVPAFLGSLLVRLRFPQLGDAVVTPVRWEAALLPVVVASLSVGAGVYAARRKGLGGRGPVWVDGGWRMFGVALTLALAGSLLLAALEPRSTAAYAQTAKDHGRAGAVFVLHHLLLLPAQLALSLAPAMGGRVEVRPPGRTAAGTIDLASIRSTPSLDGLAARRAGDEDVPLPRGLVAFLLVPAIATVGGGWWVGRREGSRRAAAAAGAGAGVAFAAFVTAAAALAATSIPVSTAALVPVTIRAAMPSTPLLALAWGVLGGAVGGLAAPRSSRESGPPVAGESRRAAV